MNASRVVTSTAWQPVSIPFRTGAGYTTGRLIAENWKGDEAHLEVDDLEIRAKGGRVARHAQSGSDCRPPSSKTSVHRLSTRTSGSLPTRRGGGANGGVVPENVSIANGSQSCRPTVIGTPEA